MEKSRIFFASMLAAGVALPDDMPSPLKAASEAYESGRLSSLVVDTTQLYPDYMSPDYAPQASDLPAYPRLQVGEEIENPPKDIGVEDFAETTPEQTEARKWILGLGGVLFTASAGLYIAIVQWARKLEQPLELDSTVKKPARRKKQRVNTKNVESKNNNQFPSSKPRVQVPYYNLMREIDNQVTESTRPTVSPEQLKREAERARRVLMMKSGDMILDNPPPHKLKRLRAERERKISALFKLPPLD